MRTDGSLESFRDAGRTLFSLGLVKGSEGNLSVFDGTGLVITRTGSELAALEQDDVLFGTLDTPIPDASSDLEVHLRAYAEHGPGAFAHCHPPGTVPEDGGGPGKHGVYAFAATLDGAVAACVRRARQG